MPFRIFVGNLPFDTTETELKDYFAAAGTIAGAHLAMDRESGRPRGFAFVEYADRSEADEAIRKFNNQPFKGRPLVVNEARPRESFGGGRQSFQPRPAQPTKPAWTPEPSRFDPPAHGGLDFGGGAPTRSRREKSLGKKAERSAKKSVGRRKERRFYDTEDDY